MEFKDIMMKEVKLTEKEKDALDTAWDIIDRLKDMSKKYIILDEEMIFTAEDVKLVHVFLNNLVETNSIVMK